MNSPKLQSDFYVYVYIDPRNLQEFYYGKGRGSRKFAHLADDSDSEKVRIIRSIKSEGLEPVIRVVAQGLTEDQALLVEKTLIWKLGRGLSNISTGHFAENFRPHETFHKKLSGFDYEHRLMYCNVGEGDHRSWDDCKQYGFLSAGQDWEKWGRKIYALQPGDIVAAYLAEHGYVGIGIVQAEAVPAVDFLVKGKPLGSYTLAQPAIVDASKAKKDGDHIVSVKWIASVGRDHAKWQKNAGLFTTQLVVASLEAQQKTARFLEREFNLSITDLLEAEDPVNNHAKSA